MSDTDSFIEEVSEEVRRDRLFKLMKRYGWIAILAVLLLVGGAAFNEVRKARQAAESQAFGDRLLSALEADDAEARLALMDTIETEGDRAVLQAFLRSAQLIEVGEDGEAAKALQSVTQMADAPEIYRHLAELKYLMLAGRELAFGERKSRLVAISAPGAAFRLLAEEQLALVEIETGEADAAIERLMAIIADQEVTAGLRRRATQLIVALGGDLEPA